MEPKRLYRAAKGEVPDESYSIELGKAKIQVEALNKRIKELEKQASGEAKKAGEPKRPEVTPVVEE